MVVERLEGKLVRSEVVEGLQATIVEHLVPRRALVRNKLIPMFLLERREIMYQYESSKTGRGGRMYRGGRRKGERTELTHSLSSTSSRSPGR